MRRIVLPLLLILTLIPAACASSQISTDQTDPQPASVSTEPSQADTADQTRTDQQGAVTVAVTPLNLGDPSDQLTFEVIMDTHSVDLGMDLATLATLATDANITVQATLWDAPRGGHHVAGKLIFPAMIDGKSILDGAGKLTLTIINVDSSSRVFVWELK